MHEVFLFEHGLLEASQHHIGQVRTTGFRLLPSLDQTALAFGIGLDDQGHSAILRITDTAPFMTEVARINGRVLGGHWLGGTGKLFGFNQQFAEGTIALVLDVPQGTVTPLSQSLVDPRAERLLLASKSSGAVLLAGRANGTYKLAWGTYGTGEKTCFPERLNMIDGVITPLAIDAAGQRLALKVHRGAQSHLFIYRHNDDSVHPVDIPPGILHPNAEWPEVGLHVVHSGPTQPAGIARATCGKEFEWSASLCHQTIKANEAHLEILDGPDGPIEAVVYGGRNWRESRHLLLALHGGPEDAWHLDFNPMFQHLTDLGIAIVAPNQRGSTGYGTTHRNAIRGDWGGPDLDDIRHIAYDLTARRRRAGIAEPLMLFGASYGAYLALLAVGSDPELWSRCCVSAPFTSSRSLYHEGSSSVRSFLRRLDAIVSEGAPGTRDVRRLVPQIDAHLLIVHGINDEIVPVSQSRHLRTALLDAGRREGVDFIYRELPTGHDPFAQAGGQNVRTEIARFFANVNG
ncbi:alpha/beta hydrolase family protein [Streptomyces wedmorensis]